MYSLSQVRVRMARENALEARQSVDSVTLQLQGLLYEILHLQKESQRCLLAHTADKDIELLPLEQFYEQAPEAISRPVSCFPLIYNFKQLCDCAAVFVFCLSIVLPDVALPFSGGNSWWPPPAAAGAPALGVGTAEGADHSQWPALGQTNHRGAADLAVQAQTQCSRA